MKLTVMSESALECRVAVVGAVSHGRQEFNDPLRNLLGSKRPRRVLLDFTGADSIDASGIRWLLANRLAIQQCRGELVLVMPPPRIAACLRLLNLHSLFATTDLANHTAESPERESLP